MNDLNMEHFKMSSLEFPDLLYPEYLKSNEQAHEILLDQWPMTIMDLSLEKKFLMQKITPLNTASFLRATTPPFTYSVASDDLTHMNKYTLSTKYKNNSNRLISKLNHLIYVTKKHQLNIQFLPNNIYNDLWSNTVEHISTSKQRKHIVEIFPEVKLLDCSIEDEQLLNIALTDQKGLLIYSYNPTNRTSTNVINISTPDQTSITNFSFNPYISSNGILIDKNYRIYLFDDDKFIYLHQLKDENNSLSNVSRRINLDWDSSPFLYTICDSHSSSCCLFDTRLRNESMKELFLIDSNHPYLSKTETIRNSKTSIVNPYQHIFITDYSLTITDSRMPNRSMIHSKHELLRPPGSFTQLKYENEHIIFINDEFNTNVIEYGSDKHRRLIQINPCWEVCPISNSRMYLINNNTHNDKQLLLAKSIYFDVPICDMTTLLNPMNSKSFILFQMNSAGNIHTQLFSESNNRDDEKTWNPDPDSLLKVTPDCFQKAYDYWSTKFLPLFQCNDCLTYNVEPTNFTVVTPLSAMTQTSLRDFSTFKNKHDSNKKVIPDELCQCPTCQYLPHLNTKGQLTRAKNWIQDLKSILDDIHQETIDTTQSKNHNWREIFDYNELNSENKDSTLWKEIHRAWSDDF